MALRVALSLAAVLLLLWYLQRRVSRSAARRADAPAIRVIGRQGLGAKAQLVVVETDDARYVLGVTEHGVSLVDRLPALPPTPPDPLPEQASGDPDVFDRLLAEASGSTEAVPPQRRVRHRNDPLRGSILSPETWRQTADALRRPR